MDRSKKITKFIGHTRFSLFTFGRNTWKASRQAMTHDEYTNYLYSPERLEFRKRLFLETSLPLLAQASENHQLKHVVSFSSNLPEEYKTHLLEASQKYSFLILNELPPETSTTDWFQAAKPSLNIGDVFATYRLDDDDLVSVDYFDRLNRYVEDAFVGMIVSFGRGITAIWDGKNFRRPSVIHKPLLAIGLAEIHKKTGDNQFASPIRSNKSHMRVDLGNPVILDSRGLDFFWARSDNQDTLYMQDTRLKRIAESNSELENATPEQVDHAFPDLTPLVQYPEATKLNDDSIQVTGTAFLPFPKSKQVFETEISYRAENGVGKESYLISFHLLNTRDSNSAIKHRIRGLSKSSDPEIGYFKAANFRQGKRTLRFSIALPDDVSCRGITVIKNEDQAGAVTLEEVSIQDL